MEFEKNKYLYEKWLKYNEIANKNMKDAKSNTEVLIEVAAQHPLTEGLYPNEEFKKRLNKAIALYNENDNVKIYVPGSIHYQDKISLSKAGKNYLIEHGINELDIFSDETNEKYKGDEGVYNSSDECYVASQIFKDGKFKEFYSICSPAQLHRKALSYIRFGYIPNMLSVVANEMFHNYIDEVFEKIPMLLEDENGLQGNSELGKEIRKKRKRRIFFL